MTPIPFIAILACVLSVATAQGYGGGGGQNYGGGGGYGGQSYGGGGYGGGRGGYGGGGAAPYSSGGYGGSSGGYGGGNGGYGGGGGGYGGGNAVPYSSGGYGGGGYGQGASGYGDFSSINNKPFGGGYGSMSSSSNYKPKYDMYPGGSDYELSMSNLYNSIMGLPTKLRNWIPNLRLKFLPPAGHTIMKHNRVYVDKNNRPIADANSIHDASAYPAQQHYGQH